MSEHESAAGASASRPGVRHSFPDILRSAARVCVPASAALAIALVSFGTAGGAETRLVGVAGSNSNTQLTRQIEDLQARVNKLERKLVDIQRKMDKPDEPDDDSSDKADKKESGGKDSGGSAGSKDSNASNGSKPDTAADGSDENLKDVIPTMTVRAPFVVVDSAGKAIFRVNDPKAKGGKSGGERGAYIYGENGAANLSLYSFSGGGRVVAQSDDGQYNATLSTISNNVGLKIIKGKRVQSYVGMVDGAKPFIAVFSADDSAAAGLQLAQDGKGLVAVFNAGQPVAFLSQSVSASGGGNVTLTDPGGAGVFSAGYTGEGGAACVNHKEQMHCLGIGLPLGGGQ